MLTTLHVLLLPTSGSPAFQAIHLLSGCPFMQPLVDRFLAKTPLAPNLLSGKPSVLRKFVER